jgi:HJR/Mrr/RecB family endonuclease
VWKRAATGRIVFERGTHFDKKAGQPKRSSTGRLQSALLLFIRTTHWLHRDCRGIRCARQDKIVRVISTSQIESLDVRQRVAWAARCARRALPVFLAWARRDDDLDRAEVAENALRLAEEHGASGTSEEPVRASLRRLADVTPRFRNRGARLAARAVTCALKADEERAVSKVAERVWDARTRDFCEREVTRLCITAADAAVRAVAASSATRRIDDAVIGDFAFIEQINKSGETSSDLRTAFATHVGFDLDRASGDSSIVTISQALDHHLIEYFRRNPERLYEMAPRQFEEFTAGFFDAFGFDVNLTQRTRDGGYDVLAIGDRRRRYSYLIECKRYGRQHKVGVGVARQLAGVVLESGAKLGGMEPSLRGLIVTTSTFTAPATEFMERNRWFLAGHDFTQIVAWLQAYERLKLAREIGLEHAIPPWT